VIAREGKGLTRYRFAQVLRLIALAQSGTYPFTQENATAALHAASWAALGCDPLPAPRIGSVATAGAPQTEGQQHQQQHQQAAPAAGNPFADGGVAAEPAAAARQQPAAGASAAAGTAGIGDLLGDDLLGSAVPPTSSSVQPTIAPAAAALDDDDDLFGLRALQQRAASHGAATSIGEGAAAAGAGALDAAAGAAAEEPGALQGSGGSFGRRLSRSMAVSSQRKPNSMLRVHTSEYHAAGPLAL